MTHDMLRAYDYVNHRYDEVRAAMVGDTAGLFQRATTVATSRAEALRSQLHARIGPLDLATEIEIRVAALPDGQAPLGGSSTRFGVEWSAANHPAVFPVMHAVLTIYPLTETETQLELEGTYEPPLGFVGKALDAVIGRRIAEASVLRFTQEVAARLREELAPR